MKVKDHQNRDKAIFIQGIIMDQFKNFGWILILAFFLDMSYGIFQYNGIPQFDLLWICLLIFLLGVLLLFITEYYINVRFVDFLEAGRYQMDKDLKHDIGIAKKIGKESEEFTEKIKFLRSQKKNKF